MELGLLLGLLFSLATAKRSDYRTAYACEGGLLHISCEEGFLIHLLRANYGRFSISICNEHGSLDWSVDCTSHRSFYIIHERCNLMSSCIVSATSDTFADPCPGTYKYLEVQYKCKMESVTTLPPKSSVVPSVPTTTTTTTTTVRPPIIIPLTRSTKPTVSTTSIKPYISSTTRQKPSTTTSLPVVVLLSSEKSLMKPSSTIPSFNKEDYCAPVHSKNLSWDWTKAGTDAVQKCPGGTFGMARWRCGTNPVEWIPESPDLSECSSLWVDNLKNRVESGDSVVNIAAELSVMTHRKPLYGGDIRHTSEILHRLISKMKDKMKEIADDKQRHQLLQELLESTSDITSNLLDMLSPWEELGSRERKNIASTLLETLEHSGWMLASAHKSSFSFRKILQNIYLSVQVLDVWSASQVTFPNHNELEGSTWEHTRDLIHFPIQSLLDTASNGVVKIVLASYKHIKDFLGSGVSNNHGILRNSSAVINSHVISAYVGRYSRTKFLEPVTITFKLLQEENVTNPQCVYWDLDSRLWSQEGCWLKLSNKTHAICQCDHLTNFALLMDIETPQVHSDSKILTKLIMLISCGVSIILLVITSILLHLFRNISADYSAINKHLCICLILAEIVYMGGADQIDILCSISAGVLHFLLQAVFAWLFLSAFQSYLLLVEHSYNSRICCYSIVAYGLPILIVSISVFVDPTSYGATGYCFLRFDNYYIFSFVGPAASCILGTFMFLFLTMCKTYWSPCEENKGIKINAIRNQNRESWFVVLSIGSTWSFLLLFMEKKLAVLAYIFSALNCLQGLAIFICLGLNDAEVQQAFKKWRGESTTQPTERGRYPLSTTSSSQNVETPYLPQSTTVSSLSTVTTPELEFQLGTFHHSELCHTRSPIYDNRDQLIT